MIIASYGYVSEDGLAHIEVDKEVLEHLLTLATEELENASADAHTSADFTEVIRAADVCFDVASLIEKIDEHMTEAEEIADEICKVAFGGTANE